MNATYPLTAQRYFSTITIVLEKITQFREFINNSKHSKAASLALLLFLTAAIPLTAYVAQQQQDIRQRAQTAPITPATPPIPGARVTYNLTAGWNPIGVPVHTTTTPFEVLAATGNQCTVLVGIDPVSQQIFFYALFPLESPNILTGITGGQGYVIYCNTNAVATFTLEGPVVADISTLYAGIQLVTVPLLQDGMLAEQFLREVAIRQPGRSCPAVVRYDRTTGDWTTVHIIGTLENNFPMSSKEGFMVWCQ